MQRFHPIALFTLSLLLAAALSITPPALAVEAAKVQLTVKVFILDDLKPTPVPLISFRIVPAVEGREPVTARTDEQGKLTVALPAGDYLLENVKPVTFKGKTFNWHKQVTLREDIELMLTDEDADVAATAPAVNTEGELYNRFIGGVVTVESEFGTGTGFLVDPSGLVMTNQHVTDGAATRWLAVRFGPGKRFPAVLIEEDAAADVALIRIDPEANPDAPVLTLAAVGNGPLTAVGERVIAMGSPLSQEQILTSGIISRVTDDTFISDVNINPGNSGGPVMNLKGEVIGLATFTEKSKTGPGISGIVPLTKAFPVLERAKAKMAELPQPERRALPDISPIKLPTAAMEEAAKADLKPYEVKEKMKNFNVAISTPMVEISQAFAEDRRLEKGRKDKTKDKSIEINLEKFHAWQKVDPVVDIYVFPLLKQTAGSRTGSIISVLLTGRDLVYDKYTFRDDFADMQLYRGGELVEPVRHNRFKQAIDAEGNTGRAVDYGYGGVFSYDPMIFEPSVPLVLKVMTSFKDKKDTVWETIKVDPKLQKKLWDSFVMWRAAVENAAAAK